VPSDAAGIMPQFFIVRSFEKPIWPVFEVCPSMVEPHITGGAELAFLLFTKGVASAPTITVGLFEVVVMLVARG
jgi:hypothetical protein